MLVGRVVQDEIGNHPDAMGMCGLEEALEVRHGATVRVNGPVVRHVVAVIAKGRREEGEEPEAVRLDYLKELGVDCLWLLPFFPSPLRDDGYDVSDYRSVHPDYGTTADFERFLEAAHAHGLRVIADFVMNHTSDQHPWFQAARRSPESPYRDYYL